MAATIEIHASKTSETTKAAVYEAIRALGEEELSTRSPVTAQCREAAVATRESTVTIRVEGHRGDWSQTSQEAVIDALAGVDGVDEDTIEVTRGGFESDADGGESDADGEEMDVAEIEGVGPARAKELRDAGLSTVSAVVDAGVDGLVDVGISAGVAANVIENAE